MESTNLKSRIAQKYYSLGGMGRLLVALAGFFVAGLLVVALFIGIAVAVAYPNLPDVAELEDYHPKLPLRIYSSEGTLIGEFGEERRQYTRISEMPKVMKDAVLAIEDARFYEHGGIDFVGVIRAGVANLWRAKSQGASTITMQVARNVYLSSEKTFTRKIYELLLASKLERNLTKDQILEIYMNQIFLGHRAYGFAAACEAYFGKSIKDITLPEAAMLAGLPKAPSAYNPINNPERARIRQQYILERMAFHGYITEAQMEAAKKQPVYVQPGGLIFEAPSEFLAEMVRQSVYAQYGDDAYTRGLNVYTTIKADQQLAAYKALRSGIMSYERRQAYRGPEEFVTIPSDAKLSPEDLQDALQDHPDNGDIYAAVVLQADPKKVIAQRGNGDVLTITGEDLKPVQSGLSDRASDKIKIKRGAVIRIVQTAKKTWEITQLPEVEGAFVAMNPTTGGIVALVGGFDFQKNKFNHVTQAWRQPGSGFKPFIYSAALEKGFTPATIVNDKPLFFDAATTGGEAWEPKNYERTFEGPVSLRRALAHSINMVSIQVLQAVGVKETQQWVTRFGFDPDRVPPYLTMALGSGSVTPLQMATAYSVFANGGYLTTPWVIQKITDSRGKVLVETPEKPLEDSQRVIDARNAFVMTSMMQEVTHTGTAAKAYATLKRDDIYGKTGTTNDSHDAWFNGFNPSVVAIAWVGYDIPKNLGDHETGGGVSLPIWISFMQTALKDVPVTSLQPPDGVVNAGGEWYYSEFSHGAGVSSLGLSNGSDASVTAIQAMPMPAAPKPVDTKPVMKLTPEQEKKSILDLFRN